MIMLHMQTPLRGVLILSRRMTTRDTDATIPADSRHPDSISRAPETQALPLGVIARRALDKGGPDDNDERRKRRYAIQKPDQVARTNIHCQCDYQEAENGSSDPLHEFGRDLRCKSHAVAPF